jgi:hypothetical protein
LTTLETFLLFHDRLSLTVMMFMLAVGLWGLFAYARGQAISGNYAGALVIGEILVAVQVVAGLALLTYGSRPPSPTHYLYGITGILVLPFAWTYMKDRDQRQALLIYALIALFIFGLAIRGMTTGRPG